MEENFSERMNILIVTDALPFPPLNGKELPIAGLFERISKHHNVDVLVLSEKNVAIKDTLALPSTIKYIGAVPLKKIAGKKQVLNSLLTLKHSISSYNYSASSIKEIIGQKQYDFVWVSPAHYYSFISFCNQSGFRFFKKAAIGLNDCKTYQFRDSINELIYSKVFKMRYLTEWLRSFPLEREERNFLSLADLVHVQTENEADKVKKVLGKVAKVKIVVAPNGIKEELFNCNYSGIDSNKILFMTHLHGHRLKESEWFIKKVWPLVKNKLPDAKLFIVGTPQKAPIDYIDGDSSIIVHGYADDVHALYNSVRFAVVPTFHGTGLINRILDALTAGVPVISTPQAIATFPGIKINEEIIAAKDVRSFADAVVEMYNNKTLRQSIAAKGKQYATAQNTWNQSGDTVERAMKDLI